MNPHHSDNHKTFVSTCQSPSLRFHFAYPSVSRQSGWMVPMLCVCVRNRSINVNYENYYKYPCVHRRIALQRDTIRLLLIPEAHDPTPASRGCRASSSPSSHCLANGNRRPIAHYHLIIQPISHRSKQCTVWLAGWHYSPTIILIIMCA